MLPGATSSKAENVFSAGNTQPLPTWMGRNLLVRICLFYMHTRVLIMHVCVCIFIHTWAIQSLPRSHFWIPGLPAAGTWTNKPIPADGTDCHIHIQISPKSALALTHLDGFQIWTLGLRFSSDSPGKDSRPGVLSFVPLVSFCLSLCPCAPLGPWR